MQTTPQTVLVLGANGRFGQAATRAFAAAGWRVLAQARRPLDATTPVGVAPIRLALGDIEGLASAATGATVVVYAVNPIYTRWDEEALPMVRAGMDIAQRLGATFMLPGNVYNYGEHMPSLLTEDTPQAPTTRKGELRRIMEDELLARAALGLRSVVLRAGDFFGSGRGTWIDELVAKSLRSGSLVSPGPLDVAHAWAYLPDLARSFVALAGRNDLPQAARLHFPGHTLTNRELLDALEKAAHSLGIASRPLRRWRMPWSLVAMIGLVNPMWRELHRMSYLWRVPHRLSGTRLAAAIGQVPVTPIDAALRATLADLDLASPAPLVREADA